MIALGRAMVAVLPRVVLQPGYLLLGKTNRERNDEYLPMAAATLAGVTAEESFFM